MELVKDMLRQRRDSASSSADHYKRSIAGHEKQISEWVEQVKKLEAEAREYNEALKRLEA